MTLTEENGRIAANPLPMTYGRVRPWSLSTKIRKWKNFSIQCSPIS